MALQLENLEKIRRDFHKYPELGFQEKRTKSKIANYLKELGLDVQCGSGIIGVLRGGDGGKAIGLRADMDALPIQETNTHSYISKNTGVMHACGHDGHMAMLLGAAYRLSSNVNFKGTIVFIFQPNEELGLGAKAMIDEGLLKNFPIEEIYGIHNIPGVPTGELLTRTGIICSSESLFEIKIRGMGGHSSMPQLGRDAITIGAEVVQSLQTIISRRIAPGSGAVVSATEFISNGQRNVLASETFSSVSAPIQYAAITAYSNDYSEYLDNSKNILRAVGNYVYENLKSNKVIINKPQGGFYLMPEFSNKTFSTSPEMCDNLLKETGVVLLPGSDFGFDKKRMLARLSFTDFNGQKFMNGVKDDETINFEKINKLAPKIIEGVDKLKKWSESI